MAQITRHGPIARLRSDASAHVLAFRQGRATRSGRGLSFFFVPAITSVAEIPVDDRQTSLFVRGRSADFQPVTAQGAIDWRVVDSARLAERVDFSLDIGNGRWLREPLSRIDELLVGIAQQAVLDRFGRARIGAILDEGVEPLRAIVAEALAVAALEDGYGLTVADVRIISLAPSAELEKALQTPTHEALQQKADEATFARRALAVDKERAIAENELANRTELARREAELISREAENARSRAEADAQERQVAAVAEADATRMVEAARSEAEAARMAIYRDLPPHVLIGLAAREFAGNAVKIGQLNVTPELGQALAAALRPAA